MMHQKGKRKKKEEIIINLYLKLNLAAYKPYKLLKNAISCNVIIACFLWSFHLNNLLWYFVILLEIVELIADSYYCVCLVKKWRQMDKRPLKGLLAPELIMSL